MRPRLPLRLVVCRRPTSPSSGRLRAARFGAAHRHVRQKTVVEKNIHHFWGSYYSVLVVFGRLVCSVSSSSGNLASRPHVQTRCCWYGARHHFGSAFDHTSYFRSRARDGPLHFYHRIPTMVVFVSLLRFRQKTIHRIFLPSPEEAYLRDTCRDYCLGIFHHNNTVLVEEANCLTLRLKTDVENARP